MSLFILIALGLLILVDVFLFSIEQYEWSIGIMTASIAAAYFLHPSIHAFVNGSWFVITTHYIPFYLLIGFGTAVIKWIFYVIKCANKISEIKKAFDIAHPEDQIIYSHAELCKRKALKQNYEIDLLRYTQDVARQARYNELHPNEPEHMTTFTKPIEPVFEDPSPQEVIKNRRIAFVEYYKNHINAHYKDGKNKIYDVDFAKDTSIVDALTPRAKDNVGLIGIWIFQWPIVVIDTLISNLLVKLAKNAARLFDMLFSAIGRKLVHKATGGL